MNFQLGLSFLRRTISCFTATILALRHFSFGYYLGIYGYLRIFTDIIPSSELNWTDEFKGELAERI
jgi:hypothetical protein